MSERRSPRQTGPANSIDSRPLPCNLDAERFILGSILLDGSRFSEVTGAITRDSWAIEKHRRIWERMAQLAERGENIDRVTLANELGRHNELESVDGLTYIVSLDDGLPRITNLDSYVRIVVEKYRLRKILYATERTKNQVLSGEFFADDIAVNGQAALAEDTGGYGSSQIETANEYVTNYPGGLNLFLDPSRNNSGIPTGFTGIDEASDGFHEGEIFVVGARPSHGKTAFASAVAKNIARQGHAVAVFTMELSKEMFLHRMICEEAFVSFKKFRRGDLNAEERSRIRIATQTVMDMPLYVDDTSGLRIADVRVKLNKIQSTQRVGLMVLDYAQLIKPPKGARFGNENEKYTLIGEEIKTLCKTTRIPMLLLSQLNRDSEKDKGDNRPKLSQCRGAGIWEEIAFLGACLYREYLRKRERSDLENIASFLIEKNRSGPNRDVTLSFTGWLMRFGNHGESEMAHNSGDSDAPPRAQ